MSMFLFRVLVSFVSMSPYHFSFRLLFCFVLFVCGLLRVGLIRFCCLAGVSFLIVIVFIFLFMCVLCLSVYFLCVLFLFFSCALSVLCSLLS